MMQGNDSIVSSRPDVKIDKIMTFYEAVRGSTEIDGFRWIDPF